MQFHSLEHERCFSYLESSEDETPFAEWLGTRKSDCGLVVTEGFEQRSLGILEKLAEASVRLPGVVIGRYFEHEDLNSKHRQRFEELAHRVSPGRWTVVPNRNDGNWVNEAIRYLATETVLLDISGLTNFGIFGCLDAASASLTDVAIGYSEAAEYWPRSTDWERLEGMLSGDADVADIVDREPWMFGYEHSIRLVPQHEGYDSASSGRALIGFLPFKPARLAAVLGEEDYSSFLLVAGRPRLPRNKWRLEALQKINAGMIRDWQVVEMSTFGYRSALEQLAELLFSENSLLERYDVHLAITGSKLQTVACWLLSCIITSITVVASIPARYYPEAFSEGIGGSWVFELAAP